MKNIKVRHHFRAYGSETVDGYQLALVRCGKCHEERKIGAPIDQVNALGGCVRRGRDEPLQVGDLLVLDGTYLQQYQATLADGQVLTWNAGGQYSTTEPARLRPAHS